MTKTDAAFVVMGLCCLLLAGGVEYQTQQKLNEKRLAEQGAIPASRYKKLEDVFVKRADQLLDQMSTLTDTRWGITGGRVQRKGMTFYVELNVDDPPAFQGSGGRLVRYLLPYTHPNTLGLFFGEKGLCRTPVYRYLNSDVNVRYTFEKHRGTVSYNRTLADICGWSKEKYTGDEQEKYRQLSQFKYINYHLNTGVYLAEAEGKEDYRIHLHTTVDKQNHPAFHLALTTLTDIPNVPQAHYLWPHVVTPALCEQLSQFDKLPLTLYATVSGRERGGYSSQSLSAICPTR